MHGRPVIGIDGLFGGCPVIGIDCLFGRGNLLCGQSFRLCAGKEG
jgi:hypothetical protein